MNKDIPAVQMRDIRKVFGKVVANDGVNLDIYRGEILSLLGENGSGKTTLMNMLSGIYYPDGGQIYIDGEPVTITSPKEAFDHGIGMIHQHFQHFAIRAIHADIFQRQQDKSAHDRHRHQTFADKADLSAQYVGKNDRARNPTQLDDEVPQRHICC